MISLAEARKYLKKSDLTDEQLQNLIDLMTDIAWMVLDDKEVENGDTNIGRMQEISARPKHIGRTVIKNPRPSDSNHKYSL
ncbi:MAG: hypothetical protein FWG80_03425 [Alphaproteobacteria bacterium]|nr:hypothetical protein [Alphaproteobacteria bacterium]